MVYLQEYDKLCMLGQGGFATIYKVRHRTLGYVRAIKVSQRDIVNENDKAYQTFLKECRVLLKIGNGAHPNIVRIYQPRLIDNKALVEMDYVRGCTLNQYLKSIKFMPIDEVMRLIQEIGSALAYCHHDIYQDQLNPVEDNLEVDPDDASRYVINDAKRKELIDKYRVIHNDLHSNNIMRRDYDGGFVLLDFGLAIQDNRAVKSSSRQDGAIEYISPEKWDNENAITTQSDIYSLGIIIYEALTGHVPFVYDPDKYTSDLQAKTDMSHKHHDVTPPAIDTQRMAAFKLVNEGKVWVKDYPDWLEQIVMKCLAKKPEDRYADAKELMNDFNRHLAEEQKLKEKERQAKDLEHTQQLQQRLNEMTASLNQTQEVLLTTQNEKQDLERKLTLSRDEKRAAEKQVMSLGEEKTHFATENERLSKMVSELETQNESMHKKVNELTKRLNNSGKSKKKRLARIAGLLALSALVLTLATTFAYNYGVDDGRNLTPELVTSAPEMNDNSVTNTANPNDTKNNEAVHLYEIIKEKDDSLKIAAEKLDEADKLIGELSSKATNLEAELAKTNKSTTPNNSAEVTRLKNQVTSLKDENNKLKSKVTHLQNQVNAFIENLQKKNK